MNKTMKTTLTAFAVVMMTAAVDAEVVKIPAKSTVTVPLAKPVKYKIYRFVTKKVGDGTVARLQFGELALYDASGVRINSGLTRVEQSVAYLDMPYGSCKLGGWCDNEQTNASYLEYLFINYLPAGIGTWANTTEETQWTWHHIYMRLSEDAPAVAAYNIAAGAGGSANQRPTAWALDGSNDGTTWETIDAVSSSESPHYLAPDLLSGYYNGGNPIPLLEATPWKNTYQVQAGGTLAVIGSVEIGDVVATGGAVDIATSATATFSPAAEATAHVGGLTGSGTLKMSGAGALAVDGDNSGFTGRIDVERGTVRFIAGRRGVKAKYYRFVVRAMDLDDSHKYCQIGELSLYDALGNRINQELKSSSASSVADMAYGTCASSGIGGRFYPGDTIEKAFDNSKLTAAEGWAESQTKWEHTWGHIYMRLAEDAPDVWAYEFMTGPDPVNNWFFNVISWSFESSDDGVNWTVHHFVNETDGKALVPTAAGIGYGGEEHFGVDAEAETIPPSSAALSVSSGAKLILPVASSVAQTKLAIDLTKGAAGEIVNCKFAENGVLELTCAEAKPRFVQEVLPITLTDAVDVTNIAKWGVAINGMALNCYKLGVDAQGRLVIDWDPKGLILTIK